MGGGDHFSLGHLITPGWMPKSHSLSPHLTEPAYVKEMLKNGENPKELLLEECKPKCLHWKHKLERCEKKLVEIIKINPTKTCLYPFRDYATCVEACVQPIIHNNLVIE
uniref:Ubiquinol-cytochrome C reductase hinge domain-containing protein n=1 Tax=Euplotes harpa TaxID=151035 RepID=A0A7S3JE42_9SPIT|mmetsp:Transcript_30785/g.35194  ORF Transcript_30785/g.35194 Transcript_30785/m.35194 type:complete len:109 (+) Transcript_30785:38-364(+)